MEAENQRLLSVHKRMVKSPNNRTKNNANLILPFMYLRTFKFNNQEIDTLKEDANKYHFQTINISTCFFTAPRKKIHQIKANKNRYQSIIFKGYYEYLIYSPKNKQYNNHHIWPIFFHEFHCSIFIYYSDCSYTFQLNQALPQK